MANFSLPPVQRPMTGFSPGNYQSYDALAQTSKNSIIVYNEEELRTTITNIAGTDFDKYTVFLGDSIVLTSPIIIPEGCDGLVIQSFGSNIVYGGDARYLLDGTDYGSVCFIVSSDNITFKDFELNFNNPSDYDFMIGFVSTRALTGLVVNSIGFNSSDNTERTVRCFSLANYDLNDCFIQNNLWIDTTGGYTGSFLKTRGLTRCVVSGNTYTVSSGNESLHKFLDQTAGRISQSTIYGNSTNCSLSSTGTVVIPSTFFGNVCSTIAVTAGHAVGLNVEYP